MIHTHRLSERILTLTLAIAATTAFRPGPAQAESATWNGSVDALWATEENWSATPVPGTGDTATFDNAGNGNTTIDLGGGVVIDTVLFDTADAAAYTIGNGTLTLNAGGAVTMRGDVAQNQQVTANIFLGATDGDEAFTFSNDRVGNSLTFAGSIASGGANTKTLTVTGAGNSSIGGALSNGLGLLALLKDGAGTLTLTAVNPFSGRTVINGGKLIAPNDARLGAVPSTNDLINITIQGGGTLRVEDSNTTLHANRGIRLGPGVQTIEKFSRRALNINSVISGDGAMNFGDSTAPGADGGGGGRLHLYGANTYTGDTTITFLGIKDPGVFLRHSLALQNTTLNYNTANAPSAGTLLWFDSGRGSFTLGGLKGNKALDLSPQGNTARNLKVGNNDQDTTFNGAIGSSADSNAGLTKIGTGTLTLTAVNTYAGATTVSNGTLRISASGRIDASSVWAIAPGGVLEVQNNVTRPSGRTLAIGVEEGAAGKMIVTGTVSLGGTLLVSGTPSPYDNFTIIENDGSDAVMGAFDGLAEADTLTIGGAQFRITYTGGDGNDVALLPVARRGTSLKVK